MKAILSLIENYESFFENKTILEIACGCAAFSIEASKIADKVVCIDLDSQRLPSTIVDHGNISFAIEDATMLSFKDHVFDTVVAYNAIGHLHAVIPGVISEALRVMKKEGQLFICSTWKLDKAVIGDVLIPYLETCGLRYKRISTNAMTLVSVAY